MMSAHMYVCTLDKFIALSTIYVSHNSYEKRKRKVIIFHIQADIHP